MSEPDAAKTSAQPDDLSQRAHRRVIGGLGLALPVLLYIIAGLRPTEGLAGWQVLDSVSAYYYTGAVAVFVGVIFSLSLFLFTYRGYKGVAADRVLGGIGGGAALVVAVCPTGPPAGLAAASWWRKSTGVVHYTAAVVLFLSFILFSIWLFRRSNVPKRGDRPPDKRRRDDVCLVCGLVMIGAVLWAGGCALADAPIFLPESVAIVAFAVSWLVKGEAHKPVAEAAKRLFRAVSRR